MHAADADPKIDNLGHFIRMQSFHRYAGSPSLSYFHRRTSSFENNLLLDCTAKG